MSLPLSVATSGYLGTGLGPGTTIYENITSDILYDIAIVPTISVDVATLSTTVIKIDLSDITIEGSC